MNTRLLLASLVLALSLAALGSRHLFGNPTASAQDKPGAAPSEKLKGLLKERLEAAQTELQAREAEFRTGRGTLDILLDSSRRVLKAQLELSDKKADQVAAWEKYLALTREIEQICKLQFEAGRKPIYEHMLAKYDRLDAEIGLERARSK